MQCLKAYKYTISNIIPKDHQKYHQREFPMGSKDLTLEVAYISYNTGTRVLPDIYALLPVL